jgi:hypothetical protein
MALIVHVRDESAGICRPAFAVDGPQFEPGDGRRLLRVVNPTPRINIVGSQDSEGPYYHRDFAVTVPNPDGSTRRLDSWHDSDDCGQ